MLRVALAVPRRHSFDYLPPTDPVQVLHPGTRLLVPFGSKRRIGVLLAGATSSKLPPPRLRRALAVLDNEPLLDAAQLYLLAWGSRYYQHPIGEVVFGALPNSLRNNTASLPVTEHWCAVDKTVRPRLSPRMRELLEKFLCHPAGLDTSELAGSWRRTLAALIRRGLVRRAPPPPTPSLAAAPRPPGPRLNEAQNAVVATCLAELDHPRPRPFLLEGVTGSGKTEVYIRVVEEVIRRGQQALVLLPEIALTPQQVQRFQERLQTFIAVLHSRLVERTWLRNWRAARSGEAGVVLGTRSAVWAPLRNPGVIIVDEEHDASYKQQKGFRYCARDVAVMRGRRQGIPVLLGTATPSLESVHNLLRRRYQALSLPQRAGRATPPRLRLLDMRGARMRGAFSVTLLKAIRANLERGQQSLIFLNRRGFAPILLCHDCGHYALCPTCEQHMTYHKRPGRLHCHRCDLRQSWYGRCLQADCDGDCLEIGHGTERLEETLADAFPTARLVRIDRDTTQGRGYLEKLLGEAHSGAADILIGTQMLAKGHHFPKLTLVAIVDADRGLYSLDFRALEHMAQLIIQVSGRAGRVHDPGLVLLQTHQPQHPLLRTLLTEGYRAFATAALAERRSAALPPYRRWALLGAESTHGTDSLEFLRRARRLPELTSLERLECLGPHTAPIPRRQGRYRSQLLLQSQSPKLVPGALGDWLRRIEKLPRSASLRWFLDVDPVEIL